MNNNVKENIYTLKSESDTKKTNKSSRLIKSNNNIESISVTWYKNGQIINSSPRKVVNYQISKQKLNKAVIDRIYAYGTY